jgi:CheY-like chemotaxis protein
MTAAADRAALESALASIVEASAALRRVNRASLTPAVAVDLARIYAAALRLKTMVTTLMQKDGDVDQLFSQSNVRHELNTPLNHIIGYSELLLEEGGIDAIAAELGSMHTAAKAMFRIVNPASASGSAVEATAATVATAVTEQNPSTTGEPGVVLLVDDDPDHRELLRRHVVALGHKTLAAEHGRRALDLLENERPDVILLDIHMPVMDGFETLASLKEHPVWREIPVIVLSALDDLNSVARCIQMGAEDYLHKPANAVLLNARIGGALTRKRLRDQELQYLNAVADVSAAAVAIELDIFEPSMLDPAAARPDAIGHLARVVQSMAREIQARHDALQRDKP